MSEYGLQVGDVIAQCNVVRSALGYDQIAELPSANRGDPAACLFYRALADVGCRGVYGDSITFASERQAQLAASLWGTRANGQNVRPPEQMRKTVSDFDGSKFAHYQDT
jgi:hypothetical protein